MPSERHWIALFPISMIQLMELALLVLTGYSKTARSGKCGGAE
jgi:hypothetical protein